MMREHAAKIEERRKQREEYESRQAIEERRRIKREQKAIAHAQRQLVTRQRNAERLELLEALAHISPAERLIRFATDMTFKLDCISADLIPAQEQDLIALDKETSIALINRIGQRKGAWGRLRRLLERRLKDIEDNLPATS
ncbi:MAG: hypothetical protein KatS3mg045_0164 [Bellilinea sp.]|nr:MAG: hypothetical protein KatS3mg045_0164 [Bellilinea sp.]